MIAHTLMLLLTVVPQGSTPSDSGPPRSRVRLLAQPTWGSMLLEREEREELESEKPGFGGPGGMMIMSGVFGLGGGFLWAAFAASGGFSYVGFNYFSPSTGLLLFMVAAVATVLHVVFGIAGPLMLERRIRERAAWERKVEQFDSAPREAMPLTPPPPPPQFVPLL